jgi:hypothetical protein
MVLQPCVRCRRHIDRHAEACPFCSAVTGGAAPRAMIAGRLSRAMLFASATMVSCDQGAKPAASQSGSAAIKPSSSFWKLHGVVTDSYGLPLDGATLLMALEGQAPSEPPITAVTASRGRYRVEGATAGRYNVSFSWAGARGSAFTFNTVTVVIGSDRSLDATMDPSVPVMPYGAPPTRRRVV